MIFAVGAQGVWRSENFGENWSLIEIPTEQWQMTSLTQVEISYANPKVVWAGAYLNNFIQTEATIHVSTDGGVSFNPVTGTPDVTL